MLSLVFILNPFIRFYFVFTLLSWFSLVPYSYIFEVKTINITKMFI